MGSKLAPNIQIVVYFLPLGTILEALGALLGGSWVLLEVSRSPLGLSWGALGKLLGQLLGIWSGSGVGFEGLGAILEQFGLFFRIDGFT